MKKQLFSKRNYQLMLIPLLLLFAGVSCFPFGAAPAQTPAITVVQVNREVTRVVIREVTRVVEVPVTVTPPPSPVATDTPLPTETPAEAASPTSIYTPVPADVSMLIHTECLYGPDPVYLGRYDLQEASPQAVIGRNQDGSWLVVKGADHTNPCWVEGIDVKVNSGSLDSEPVVTPDLSPYSKLYPPPAAVSANRVGDDVTVFWIPVPMAQADYQGYLIEAWVCQGGQQVFVPLAKSTTFDDTAMKALKFTDEPGCVEPSSARIYSVSNQGYSTFRQVLPWPAPAPTTQ